MTTQCDKHMFECDCDVCDLIILSKRKLQERTGYFPPPWTVNAKNKNRSEGWFAFQDALRKDPRYYLEGWEI